MHNIKISIIVPIYNSEKFLSRCLNSIVNQTLKEIEIICINDGSTDKSGEILKEYNDNRIKIINKENGDNLLPEISELTLQKVNISGL